VVFLTFNWYCHCFGANRSWSSVRFTFCFVNYITWWHFKKLQFHCNILNHISIIFTVESPNWKKISITYSLKNVKQICIVPTGTAILRFKNFKRSLSNDFLNEINRIKVNWYHMHPKWIFVKHRYILDTIPLRSCESDKKSKIDCFIHQSGMCNLILLILIITIVARLVGNRKVRDTKASQSKHYKVWVIGSRAVWIR
jgi:hypothetical protein